MIVTNRLHILCDFDGTVTVRDTVDVLLSELAEPEWEAIEEEWVQGKIGSRECMERQVALIRGGWTAMQRVLDSVEFEPDFVSFVSWCRSKGFPITVVSDGIDRAIRYLFDRRGVIVDAVYANHLVEASDGSFRLLFSQSNRKTGCQSGVCKCRIAGNVSVQTVVIGDGRSDFCWAKEADFLFAKSKLADHCRVEHIPFSPFENFTSIAKSLESILTSAHVQPVQGITTFPGVPGIAAS
jgi:2-hydroxy-3-keto-5-methylthiopentenyl-1-phosphate phosphatase